MKLFQKNIYNVLIFLISLMCLFSVSSFAQEEQKTVKKTEDESFVMTPGIFEITSCIDEEYTIDAKYCSALTKSFGNIQIFKILDVNQQKFYFENIGEDLYRISAMNDGQAFTASADGSSAALSTVDLTSETGYSAAQAWLVEDAGNGYVYISSADGHYLTMEGRNAYNGCDLVLSSKSGRKNQKWKLVKAWVGQNDTADTDAVNPYAEDGAYSDLALQVDIYGDHSETLTAQMLSEHMSETVDTASGHQFLLDEDYLTSFVQGIADTYDTQDKERKFKTQAGNVITLSVGNFGWKLNTDDTAALIKESISYNGKKTIEPVWSHSVVKVGNDNDLNDIGDSYVEVDLANQKVWLVKEGKVLKESDCVTGTYGTSRQTPAGIYSIFYMQSPAVLTGTGYSSNVTYWMPFNNGIGLHDATWRSSFGGDIFKTNGSHGCINLPTDMAKLIYETVCIGYPVVLYE